MAPPSPPDRKDEFQPPLISLSIAGLMGGATYWLTEDGARYSELLPLAAVYTGWHTLKYTVKAVADHHKLASHRKKIKKFHARAQEHGGSGIATAADIERSEYLSWEQGVYIGQIKTAKGDLRHLFAAGNYHISVIAPAGQQKTMAIVVPSLLRWRWEQGHLLVNDPSGEILALCRDYLESIGFRVVICTAFPEELNRLTRPKKRIEDARLDIFSALRDRELLPSMIREVLTQAMTWLCREKAGASEESLFFLRAGRLLGVFLAMHDLVEGRHPNLVTMRQTLMRGVEGLKQLFYDAADQRDAFDGVYAETALSLSSMIETAGPQFAGGFGVCEQALEKYDHFSSLGRHVSGATHDPADFSDPSQRVAYFVSCPPAKMKAFSDTTAMTLSYLLDTIASHNSPVATTAFIDEAGSLALPGLADSMNFYRKMANLRLVLIWQDLFGQAEEKYGKAVVRQLMSGSLMKLLLGVVEPQTLQMASALTGKRATLDSTINDNHGNPSNLAPVGQSFTHKTRATMEADEIRQMQTDQLLAIVGNVKPIVVQKTPYWRQPELADRAGPSPYHKG
jgi:type IV secretion system protein VirD4